MIELTEKQIKAFWSKIDIKSSDECWEWKAGKSAGYGSLAIGLAHRISYTLHYGSIPYDKPLICHRCDNPACCNYDHLWAGTIQDNNADKTKKGRASSTLGVKPVSNTSGYVGVTFDKKQKQMAFSNQREWQNKNSRKVRYKRRCLQGLPKRSRKTTG